MITRFSISIYLANGSEWDNDYRETQSYDVNGNWIEWIGYVLAINNL